MAVDDTMVPLSEDGKIPSLYSAEDGDVKKQKDLALMEMSQPLIGLTKEQLEKYRNDPFWKPFRTFMFVLFWLIWIAMFAGAILIVVLSPKCAAKTKPEWWRTEVSYQIFTPSFRDTDSDGVGDFKGITEKLDDIRKIGVKNIWATPIIATDKDEFEPFDVVDFNEVDKRFGTVEDLKSLITEIHRRDMHFVMDLPISTTSQKHNWFIKSAKGEEEYKDFYLWEKSDEVGDDRSYVRLNGTNKSFMAYEGKNPILNWHNDKVENAISVAACKFLDIGVDGFHIGYVAQLGKNYQLASNAKKALEALESFKSKIELYASKNDGLKEKKIALFTSLEDITQLNGGEVHDMQDMNLTSIEYVIDGSAKKLNREACKDVAKCVHSMLNQSLERFQRAKLPHVWQFTDWRVSRLSSRFGSTLGNLMTFVQLNLPGAVEIYYGQELGMKDAEKAEDTTSKFTGVMQWDDSEKAGFTDKAMNLFFGMTSDYKTINYKSEYRNSYSPLKVFRRIAKLRQRDDTLLLGDVKLGKLTNSVVKFSRKLNGLQTGPVYVIIANFGDTEEKVEIKSLIPSEYTKTVAVVVATSPEFRGYAPNEEIDFAKELTLPLHQGMLLKVQ